MNGLLPIGLQSFENLRTSGFKYVDKTRLVYRLAKEGNCCLLYHPRRFGKSLLISTLEAYLKGKKELFQGLAIEKLEMQWNAYPVLHLDLNARNYSDIEALNLQLIQYLEFWEQEYGKDYSQKRVEERFSGIIRLAYEKTRQKVVILVDEYDKPLLEAIDNPELQESYRKILKGFYGSLKSMDQYIRFAMLTGVTKFGKVSVFSDLNNLRDISMQPQYHDICGITQKELEENFQDYLQDMSKELNLTLGYSGACSPTLYGVNHPLFLSFESVLQ